MKTLIILIALTAPTTLIAEVVMNKEFKTKDSQVLLERQLNK